MTNYKFGQVLCFPFVPTKLLSGTEGKKELQNLVKKWVSVQKIVKLVYHFYFPKISDLDFKKTTVFNIYCTYCLPRQSSLCYGTNGTQLILIEQNAN